MASYLDGAAADVAFVCSDSGGEERLHAHKLILEICSPVFRAMFAFDAKCVGPSGNIDASATTTTTVNSGDDSIRVRRFFPNIYRLIVVCYQPN